MPTPDPHPAQAGSPHGTSQELAFKPRSVLAKAWHEAKPYLAGAVLGALVCFCLVCAQAASMSLRQASLLSLAHPDERAQAWSMLAKGPDPAFARAQELSAQALAQFKALGLPSTEGLLILNFVKLSSDKPNSYAWPSELACVTIHGLGPDASSFAQREFALSGVESPAEASIAFATAHEAGHCSFHRKLSGQRIDRLAAAREALASRSLDPALAKPASAWLAKAWGESYSDLIAIGLLARRLPEGSGSFQHIASLMLSRRVMAHLASLRASLPEGADSFDMASLGVHYTQFAIQDALRTGQARLRAMGPRELEDWAFERSLSSTAQGMMDAPEFAWLFGEQDPGKDPSESADPHWHPRP